MLSRETEQKLAEIFISLSIGEEKINKLKQNIISNYNINPIQIFFKLDINNVGYLSKNDFFPFLKFFSVNFFPSDIDYIFYFYDKDEDNILCFNEFLDLIISDSNYFYKKAYKKKFRKNRFDLEELNGNCEPGVENRILEILLEEIELSRHLSDLILNIKQYNDFNIQKVFYEIKSYSYITSDSLKAFFDRNEVDYNEKFVKNIFSRLSNKDKNCKISFNKFKKLFDLPFNKNIMTQMPNQIPLNLSQTYASNDIKFSSTDNNKFMNSNISNINQNLYNNKNEFYNNIRNENYLNEEDIQFECNHLSRSGSIESNKKEIEKINNCKYISKTNKRSNLYKNYLREKRSKSLEKSLTKSLCKTNEGIPRKDKRIIFDKNIRNIKIIKDNDYNTLNEGNFLNNSGYSFNKDLQENLPVRLDKNLIKRPIPNRINHPYNNFNISYANHFEDLNMRNKIDDNKENENYNTNIYIHNSRMHYKKTEDNYNTGLNNLDLKIYQEDLNSQINDRIY